MFICGLNIFFRFIWVEWFGSISGVKFGFVWVRFVSAVAKAMADKKMRFYSFSDTSTVSGGGTASPCPIRCTRSNCDMARYNCFCNIDS